MEKLKWKVKHNVDFTQEIDFLETILKGNGVEDIRSFLTPTVKFTLDPFTLNNMQEGIELLHNNLHKQIFIKVDCDVDGFTSSAYLRQFILKLNPDAKIEYRLDFNKRHGLFYEDVAHFEKDELGLIIVPDASVLVEEAKKIKDNLGEVPILILDHHEIEEDNMDMFKYATVINCMVGEYANKCLSGVGVVHKFCLAYCDTYNINQDIANYYLDLVALGMISDSMDLRSLEDRYYVLEGLKEENRHNELIKEMMDRNPENFFGGKLTIHSAGWSIGPLINATIRYGKPEEQIDLFRALCGEQEDREYQPRRKHKEDPKPPVEIHSLQKTMARVCDNVKSRQDTEVRNFMKKIETVIEKDKLLDNSILAIDGSEILTKSTVTGLVANKLASKYKRPVLIFKNFTSDTFGGSGRNYDKGAIEDLRSFLGDFELFDKLAGHDNAFGIEIKKEKVETLIKTYNEKIPLSELVTIHEVDYEVPADKLKIKDIHNVANAYQIWGNSVNEPMFAITNLRINAQDIHAYGENQGFIRFVYRGIPFIKKYCPKGDYDQMVLRTRKTLGASKKDLKLNLICSFTLNEYEGKITPQVKIWFYDSVEVTKEELEEDWVF